MPSSEDYDRPLNPELNVEFKLNSETLDKINEDPDAFISAINAAFSNIRKFGVGKSTTLGVPYESGTEQYMN